MKKQILIVGIIVLLIVVGLSGCQEKTSTESAEGIITNTVNAFDDITSYSCSSNGVIIYNDVKTGITEGYTKVDVANKKLMTIQNLSIMFGNSTSYIYIIDDVQYTNITESPGHSTLSKKNITQDVWNNYDILNQTYYNISETTRLEDESIMDVECFVLKMIPNLESYSQSISNESFGNYQLISVETKYWIDKNSYLPMKSFMRISMNTSPSPSNAVVYTVESYSLYSDYNNEFLIELPEWAINTSWV